MKDSETSEVISLGAKLKRKHRKMWRRVELDAFEGDPGHIMSRVPKGKKGGDSELFLLYSGGEPVGTASATVDKGWASEGERKEKMGFIDGFVIHPDYKHLAGELINRCLSALKDKGAEAVVVRSQAFPALAAQEFDDLAPGHLPTNPPWYIDLFEQEGFVKQKEWGNFRFNLPRGASQEELDRWDAMLARRGMKVKKLTGRSRKELKQYSDVAYEVLVDHYGYMPSRFMDSYSFIRFLLFGLFTRIAKVRIYVLCNTSGDIVGFCSYHPDFNIALNSINRHSRKRWYNPTVLKSVPDFLRCIRRAKRATVGSIGLREESRRKGFIRSVDWVLGLILKEGYEQLDTGPVLIDNAVVVKMAENFSKRYGIGMERTRYYTLQYDF